MWTLVLMVLIFFESETHVLYDHFLVQTVTKPHFL